MNIQTFLVLSSLPLIIADRSSIVVIQSKNEVQTGHILNRLHTTNLEVEILQTLRAGRISVHVQQPFLSSVIQTLRHRELGLDEHMITVHRVRDIEMSPDYKRRTRRSSRKQSAFDINTYNTYNSIMEYLLELEDLNPELCTVHTIGSTYEGRAIRVLQISAPGESRPRVYIDGGQHAREWISPAVLVQLIHKFVYGYLNGDPGITDLLNKYDFYIHPLMNPDGYIHTYSIDGERFWRKNRKNSTYDFCVGVDLNRNWNYQWAGPGGSEHDCSNLYYGPTGFSEEETSSAANFILQSKGKWLSYFSFHSYGQMVLYPYSHTSDRAPDWQRLNAAGRKLADGIKKYNNTDYIVGSVGQILYAASGSSESWAYAEADIPYAYTVELPDLRDFVLPKERIGPTTDELISGFKEYFGHIEKEEPELLIQLRLNVSANEVTRTSNPFSNIQSDRTTPINASCREGECTTDRLDSTTDSLILCKNGRCRYSTRADSMHIINYHNTGSSRNSFMHILILLLLFLGILHL